MYDSCCPIQNQVHPKVPVFFYSLQFVFFYSFYMCFISSHKITKFIDTIIFFSSYFSFAFLAYYIKDVLGDTTCNGRPNSLSGHTFYNVFFFTSFLTNYFSLGKNKSIFHRLWLFIVEVLLLVNISLTYLGGYHTPRQMVYGAVMGLLVVVLYKILRTLFSRSTNILLYLVNLLIWLYISTQHTSVKPSYDLIVKPGLFCGALLILAYYLEKREIRKLE